MLDRYQLYLAKVFYRLDLKAKLMKHLVELSTFKL